MKINSMSELQSVLELFMMTDQETIASIMDYVQAVMLS